MTSHGSSAPANDADDPMCPDCGGRRVATSPLRQRVRRVLRPLGVVLAWPLVALVRVYQLVISPLTPPSCRYYPSCSAYALTALRRFGPLKGTWLAVRRVLRCHPWAPGGVDYVPDAAHTCSCAVPSGSASGSDEPIAGND